MVVRRSQLWIRHISCLCQTWTCESFVESQAFGNPSIAVANRVCGVIPRLQQADTRLMGQRCLLTERIFAKPGSG
ncbi:hypothetical protein BDP67DRAFT_525193 [Colletotrichum lupini]|nr:hypothetical protein BDP67DRAFT_525193 [Colletotrichum lupini]